MGAFAHWCLRHRKLVVLAWIVGLVGLFLVSHAAGTKYTSNFSLPKTESTKAIDLLQKTFPEQSGESDQIVVHTTRGTLHDDAVKQRLTNMFAHVSHLAHVRGVTSPYAAPGQTTADNRTAFATVHFDKNGNELDRAAVKRVISVAQAARQPGLQVELAGDAIEQTQQNGLGPVEAIGLTAAAVVLFIAFGSVVAMFLPLLTAGIALACALFLIVLLTHVFGVADFAPTLATLLGLGAGIDYALFIVTRYRQNVQAGIESEEAVAMAVNTSGRAVFFAGLTVCIAVLGMFALQVEFLRGIAVATAIAVFMTMVAALTLLPALLGFLGRHVLSRRDQRRLDAEGPHAPELSGRWASWAAIVQRRPWIALVASTLVMIVLALPVVSLRMGVSDQGNNAPATTTRKAYDLVAKGFGPGFNAPFLVAVDTRTPAGPQVVDSLEQTLRTDPAVAAVAPAAYGPNRQAAIIQLFPKGAPQDKSTTDLLTKLRDKTIPAATQGTGTNVYVGGATAIFNDFSNVLARKLPQFIGIVVLLSFLLLMTLFRSLIVPVKAALLNLLSIAAAFGVVIAVFQWGWGASVIGVDRSGPIDAFLPVMLFAILFGLSMDYEVFLVSRIHEEWVRTGDNSTAVTRGLAATGRVITAAAAIMIVIFTSFVFGGERTIKLFGLGFAVAVFLDAVVVRSVLVPAFMQVVGKANWWLPHWLDRLLPDVHLEAEDVHPETELSERQQAMTH
ncbi:MAG: MMPL family transporter [Actinomycetes bacterium]